MSRQGRLRMSSGKSEASDGGWVSEDRIEIEHFDWADEDAVTLAVVEAVSAVTGQDPVAMRPLGEVIDSEALAMLFASTPHNDENYAQFEYEGCFVRVKADGTVRTTPVENE